MTDRSFKVHMAAITFLLILTVILNIVGMFTGMLVFPPLAAIICAVVGLIYLFVIIYRARMEGLI